MFLVNRGAGRFRGDGRGACDASVEYTNGPARGAPGADTRRSAVRLRRSAPRTAVPVLRVLRQRVPTAARTARRASWQSSCSRRSSSRCSSPDGAAPGWAAPGAAGAESCIERCTAVS
ncbi:hypothetical protein SGRIM128S_08425 [Streptomyces griseomycini]